MKTIEQFYSKKLLLVLAFLFTIILHGQGLQSIQNSETNIIKDLVSFNRNGLLHITEDSDFNLNMGSVGNGVTSSTTYNDNVVTNPDSFITIEVVDTVLASNNARSNGNYLRWSNNNSIIGTRNTPISINLGSASLITTIDVSERTWKFEEQSSSALGLGEIKLSVATSGLSYLPTIAGNDSYVMVTASDETFTTNLKTTFFKVAGAHQELIHNFDDTTYVKFGVAHETVAAKEIRFNGVSDYILVGDDINLNHDYTVTAWVNTNGSNSNSTNKTIISKNQNSNDGYQLYITDTNHVAMSHNNTATIISNTALSNNVWRYITFTYTNGVGELYIDGILDTTQAIAAPLSNTASFSIGSKFVNSSVIADNFSGSLDEIRIFSTKISEEEIRFMMNQEIESDGMAIKGNIIPNTVSNNDISNLTWNNLEAYFDMNRYSGTSINDASVNGYHGHLAGANYNAINDQKAPLPYRSTANGSWNDASTWEDGNQTFAPGATRVINGLIVSVNWNIAVVNNNLTMEDKDYTLMSLEVTPSGIINTVNDRALTLTHKLKLDGTINLQGESQLIQGTDSDLSTSTTGKIKICQQGTSSLYNYNYWSSPVSTFNSASTNSGYAISTVLKDGTLINNPRDLNFTTQAQRDGAPGTATVAATISSRWLYKYGNSSSVYTNWEYMGPHTNFQTGMGFTMKGTGTTAANQNYIFTGKPNNGDIDLNIGLDKECLVGNPYPSALDIHEFILDNQDLDGTVYLWKHLAGNSHIQAQYVGGYAAYNLSGAVATATFGTLDPNVNQGGEINHRPKRYVPVAQGFVVKGIHDNGKIKFRNSQRKFVKESNVESIFVSAPGASSDVSVGVINTPSDPRSKIRLGFNSSNLIHRQLLVTEDSNATLAFDKGYDGKLLSEQMDDMSWKLPNQKLVIQGVPTLDAQTELPLSIKLRNNSSFDIMIDDLKNIDPTQAIYIKDAVLNTYVNLMNGNYTSPNLPAGTYEDRFFLTFSNATTLSNEIEEINDKDLIVFTPTGANEVHIKTSGELEVETLSIYNMLGQQVIKVNTQDQNEIIKVETSQLASGNYIIKMDSNLGIHTRKVNLK